jgi:DNA-binding MarR family transcriptional regulator
MVDEEGGPTPGSHVVAAVERLNRRVGADLVRIASPEVAALRGSHHRLLDLIAEEGSRPSALTAGAWISKQAVGQRLRELEQRGLVSFAADPADGRAVVVRRTEAGDQVRRSAQLALAAVERGWADAVGPERYATFRHVLDELGRAADPSGTP